jgi:hypothetical protein
MWQQGIDIVTNVFSSDVTEMIRLSQDYLYNPGQFDSVKDRYSSYPQFISVAASNSTLIHLLIL